MIAPTYEQGWLYRFARQRGWTREETFVVDAAPTACFEHLYGTPGRDRRYNYTIDAQDLDGEYEFKVRIEGWPQGKGKSPSWIRTVIGQIRPHETETQQSLVTIRTYPQITGISIFLSIVWVPVLILCGFINTIPLLYVLATTIMVLVTMLLVLLWFIIETFVRRQKGLAIVHDIMTLRSVRWLKRY